MKFVLVRHPPAEIAPGICYGRLDMALRADAAPRVRDIASSLARCGLERIWSSPAIRCRFLAEAAATLADVKLQVDPRLQELDFGTWEGRKWNDVPRAALDVWAADPHGFAPPQGETGAALIARVQSVYQALLAARQDCAVISHGGPLKLLAALMQDQSPDLLATAPPLGSMQIFTTS